VYYAGTVAKGAVFLHFCGWMGSWELWAGAISKIEYQMRSGVFEYMRWFVESFCGNPLLEYCCSWQGLPLHNGCLACWEATVPSTCICEEHRKFNPSEVQRSATVAVDRSGNERAVNVVKRAGVCFEARIAVKRRCRFDCKCLATSSSSMGISSQLHV
jgi:hypothetical protein